MILLAPHAPVWWRDGTGKPSNNATSAIAKEAREQFVADSIGMALFKPDSLRENKFLTAIHKNPLTDIFSSLNITIETVKRHSIDTGAVRVFRNQWLMVTIFGLLIY
ncbi:MAG: hypothetical protein ABI898_05930, partial [Sphingomonadales bacterium]